MKTMILGNLSDGQTGIYLLKAFKNVVGGKNIKGVDVRKIHRFEKPENIQNVIIREIKGLDMIPELIVAMKGLEMSRKTWETIKDLYPNAKIVNWFFDKYLMEKPIWKHEKMFSFISFFDYFFCSLKGAADKLNELGLNNVSYLDEGCDPEFHGEVYMNQFQEKKYGEDIAFAGSLGFFIQHPYRIPLLEKIGLEGFNMKIWGDIICDNKRIPQILKLYHMNAQVINDKHSMMAQASLINIGIDQDLDLDMGFSARLYRTMAAGGLYLSTNTKGLNKMFKVNKEGKPLTGKEDLVVFYSEKDMINKIDFLLEHDKIRDKIRLNGQKKVLKHHTFEHRVKKMLKILRGEK